jgi:hypothetical protein
MIKKKKKKSNVPKIILHNVYVYITPNLRLALN